VSAIELPTDRIVVGESGFTIGGRLGPGGTTVRLMLAGDVGHWIVPGGFADAVHPDEVDWQARLDFSPELPLGPRALLVQATDAAGRAGGATAVALTVTDDAPTGAMTVRLAFDADGDLDLRVLTPSGVELDAAHGARDGSGAFVDHDANAGCRIDGRRREVAVWPTRPAPGRYTAFVALESACGVPRVTFTVEARLGDVELGRATGALYPEDARLSGRLGAPAGVRALVFDVP
jgi:hypothetical protein